MGGRTTYDRRTDCNHRTPYDHTRYSGKSAYRLRQIELKIVRQQVEQHARAAELKIRSTVHEHSRVGVAEVT
jgi:hypothetical protein